MVESRKLAAILAADIVGYSRLTSVDEDRTLARVRALRAELIDPVIAANRGRVVKRTGDGAIVEFRSAVDAVNCARETQNGMIERNSGLPDDQKIVYRIGIHIGDVVEEEDGDLMGEGVNIAARLEGIAKPGAICLSEDAYRQVRSRLDLKVNDLGPTALKNIAEPVRVYSLEVGAAGRGEAKDASVQAALRVHARARRVAVAALVLLAAAAGWWALAGRGPRPPSRPSFDRRAAVRQSLRRPVAGLFRRRRHRKPHHRSLAHPQQLRDRAQHRLHLQGQERRRQADRQRTWAFVTSSKAPCSAIRTGCASTRN